MTDPADSPPKRTHAPSQPPAPPHSQPSDPLHSRAREPLHSRLSGDAPLWRQIHAALSRDIADGRWPAGTHLPSEADLARRFGVNRHTLRRAMAQLREAGAIHVRRGAGAVVTEGRIDYRLGPRTRFSANLTAAGRIPGRRLLRLETIAASRAEALALDLAPGDPVHVAETLAEADGVPVIHSVMTFPGRLSALPGALAAGAGVTEALAACGIADYTRAWTRLSAGRPGALVARHLMMADGAAGLFTESVSRAEDGRSVEYGRSWFCTDRMSVIAGEGSPPDGL
jgi:GntR family phosphonate transport system transcriptional regulator